MYFTARVLCLRRQTGSRERSYDQERTRCEFSMSMLKLLSPPSLTRLLSQPAKILSQREESPVQDEPMTDQLYEASQYERGSFCVGEPLL